MRLFVVMFKHCDFIAFFLRPLKLRTWRQTLSQLLLSKNASLHGNSGINSKVLSPSCSFLLPSSKLLKDGCVTLRVSDWNSRARLLMMLFHSVLYHYKTSYKRFQTWQKIQTLQKWHRNSKLFRKWQFLICLFSTFKIQIGHSCKVFENHRKSLIQHCERSLYDTSYDEWQNNISDKQVNGVC